MHGPTEIANLAMALKWADLYANGAPGDWVMEATTEDVTWQEPPWRFYPQGRVIEGRAQLLEEANSSGEAFIEKKMTVKHAVADGDSVVLQLRFEATTAAGRTLALEMVSVQRYHDGLIREATDYITIVP